MLVGVGFSCQAAFEGTHYRRLPASRDPRFAWMFDGIEDDVIGDYGLSGGGAAGFELDRADTLLGTPDERGDPGALGEPVAVVPAPCRRNCCPTPRRSTASRCEDLARGEIVYFDTPSGGAVFSVGSITFCGSLWRNGFEGPVSRLLENVVRRFAGVAGRASPAARGRAGDR